MIVSGDQNLSDTSEPGYLVVAMPNIPKKVIKIVDLHGYLGKATPYLELPCLCRSVALRHSKR